MRKECVTFLTKLRDMHFSTTENFYIKNFFESHNLDLNGMSNLNDVAAALLNDNDSIALPKAGDGNTLHIGDTIKWQNGDKVVISGLVYCGDVNGEAVWSGIDDVGQDFDNFEGADLVPKTNVEKFAERYVKENGWNGEEVVLSAKEIAALINVFNSQEETEIE